jgi:hypothetical protein
MEHDGYVVNDKLDTVTTVMLIHDNQVIASG